MTNKDLSPRYYKLNNGLVVALQNTLSENVLVYFQINQGSCHEKSGEEGLTHLLEHCLITSGSSRYSPEEAEKLRKSFGYSNATTSVGRVSIELDSLKEDFESMLSFASNSATNPLLDSERVESEKNIVFREVTNMRSNPQNQANMKLRYLLYGDHPRGRDGCGDEEVIKSATPDKLRIIHQRGFHPNNFDLFCVGGLPENAEELIEKYLGYLAPGPNTRMKFPPIFPLSGKTILEFAAPETINASNPEDSPSEVEIYFRAPTIESPDFWAASHLTGILRERLYQSIRVKHGLAYNTGVSYNTLYNVGDFSINTQVSAKKAEQAVNLIFEDMALLKTEKVTDDELAVRIKGAKYSLASELESNAGCIRGMKRFLDNGLTRAHIINGCSAVTREQILRVANQYFPGKETGNYVLVIRDPFKK